LARGDHGVVVGHFGPNCGLALVPRALDLRGGLLVVPLPDGRFTRPILQGKGELGVIRELRARGLGAQLVRFRGLVLRSKLRRLSFRQLGAISGRLGFVARFRGVGLGTFFASVSSEKRRWTFDFPSDSVCLPGCSPASASAVPASVVAADSTAGSAVFRQPQRAQAHRVPIAWRKTPWSSR
jgi:hypothetical protein